MRPRILDEHAWRSRKADTAALLEPIGRSRIADDDASAVQRLRDDLRMLLIARPEIDAPGPAVHAAKPQSWP